MAILSRPLMNFMYICHDGRYRFRVLLSTIPTPGVSVLMSYGFISELSFSLYSTVKIPEIAELMKKETSILQVSCFFVKHVLGTEALLMSFLWKNKENLSMFD